MSYIKPQDQIQDGVTSRSPSENAVHDALALKANTNLQNLSFSGSDGQFLSLVSGVPAWTTLPASGANQSLSNLSSPTALNQVLRGQDGTASAPAYSFTSESTLGIYRPGSASFAVASSITGSAKDLFYVDKNSAKLGTSNSGGFFTLSLADSYNGAMISLDVGGTPYDVIQFGGAGSSITLGVNSYNGICNVTVPKGKLGVGTASPSVQLEVNAGTSTDMLRLVSNTLSYTLSRDNTTGNLTFTGSQTGFVGYTFSSPGGDRLTIAGNGNVTIAENLTVSKQSTLTGIVGVGIAPATGVALNILGATDSDQLRIGNAGGSIYYQMGRESNEGYLVFNGNQTNYSGYIFKEDGSEVFRIARDKNIKATGGDISIETAGKGLKIKTGSNATAGIQTGLSSVSSVTISTTAVLSTSLVFVQPINTSDKHGFSVSSITNATSFTVDFSGNYTGDLAWFIINPA